MESKQSGTLVKVFCAFAWLALTSCGGDGAGPFRGSTGTGGGGGGSTWVQGSFKSEATFANQCASPRSGTDPVTGQRYPDVAGSTLSENNWLRSWTHDLYLWYDEVTDVDPSLSSTPDYFNLMKTTQMDAAGQPKDKFHFTYQTSTWETLSTQDVQPGYGVQWVLVSTTPPRQLVIAYTIPNTPATAANLSRGAEILTIDGVDLVNANDQASIDTLNAGISPSAVGQTHTFTVRDLGSGTTRTVSLTSQAVTENPVPLVSTFTTANGTAGYIVFDDQEATAESGLITAVNQLKSAGINDLIIDMRYNGGGYLDIASELAYMVAGPVPTTGQTFYNQQFNAQHPATNPVTGEALTPTGFHTQTLGLSTTAGQALPTLNLTRVFVLTGPSTCSASEAVMNGLQGVNVQVIQIGNTTCGKPYGFYPQDNCGTTYFSIEFRGINAQGFGNYPDGFTASNSNGAANGATLPGCTISDDFTHELGDPAEARLSAALSYTSNPVCPASPGGNGSAKHTQRPLSATDGRLVREPGRELLILRQ
jgi:hypothetical protein